jgi:hypothetical protein
MAMQWYKSTTALVKPHHGAEGGDQWLDWAGNGSSDFYFEGLESPRLGHRRPKTRCVWNEWPLFLLHRRCWYGSVTLLQLRAPWSGHFRFGLEVVI